MQLSGTIPPSLGNLTALTELVLMMTQLSGTIPDSLGHLTALTYMNLSNTDISGTIPDSLGRLTALTMLHETNAAATLKNSSRLQVGMIGFVDPHFFFEDFPRSLLGFEDIPQLIHDLSDEWEQPIPIAIDFLEDELDLKATIIRVTMEPKAIKVP